MNEVTPFDWYRIFIGEHPPAFFLEVLFRIVFIYFCGVVILRFAGKRGRKTFTAFDMLMAIALGSAMGDVMFYPQVPLLYAVVVLVTVVLLNRLLAIAQRHSEFLFWYITGRRTQVIDQGQVNDDMLRKESLSREELFSMLRMQGISNTGELAAAYLELSGGVSVCKTEDGATQPDGVDLHANYITADDCSK